MIVKRIPAGVYAANCYLLIDDKSNECAVIDPGGDCDDIIKEINSVEVIPKFVLLTHGHADHIGAVGELTDEFGIKAYINKWDGDLINEGAYMFGPLIYKGEAVEFNMNIKEGDTFKIGDSFISCIETPGHSPGGMCFLIDNMVLTGDTLFLRSIGRTDLIGGDFDTLIHSIKTKLMALEDNIIVLPGHGPQSTIGYEKANNPFL